MNRNISFKVNLVIRVLTKLGQLGFQFHCSSKLRVDLCTKNWCIISNSGPYLVTMYKALVPGDTRK